MASYKERILEVIGESEVGLTTVDVAKKARVSKTTVIKYLSVLSSEGEVEFVEVGPSKLWRTGKTIARHGEGKEGAMNAEAFPMMDIDFHNGEDETIYFSFRVKTEQICKLLKRAKKCDCEATER